MEVLFVVVWLVCGAIGAAIMCSGVGGFALGVLLGPIGLIIALLLSRSEENEAERQLSSSNGFLKPYRRGNDSIATQRGWHSRLAESDEYHKHLCVVRHSMSWRADHLSLS